MRRDETEQMVGGGALKESERDGCGRVFFVLVKGTCSQTKRIEERAQVEVASRIHQVNAHGREIGALTVLLDWIVRCEKSRGGNDAVERHQDDEPSREFAALRHSALAAVRIRGSAK
jgi:hypothetical protein